jgi:hypothetical protein
VLIAFIKEGEIILSREHVKVKSVHFNTKREDDKLLLKGIGKKNFSKYVKQLIKEDQKKKELLKQQPIKSQDGKIVFKLEES